ncbi:MAG: dTDP-4-dehydrorhamnose 3,5-epimerase [Archangium sp.]|nr:dTDP-4-dehydrorhamnose 3,5-epimerase [Archangium sp.]MDP3569799.1 dTDP-4-dehydrorhamnose 3,5-epimerase [Archangium sp.]
MNVDATPLPGVLLITPRVFSDARGFFMETFHAEKYAAHGVPGPFVQDNWSHSVKDTLRGLHFQNPNAQGKLVCVTRGAVFDVAVDVRVGSPHFGKWYGCELSESNRKQLWVPPGFAHGFCCLSDETDFLYKCTALYAPGSEHSILWNDPAIGIEWPTKSPLLSKKDLEAPVLAKVTGLPSL